MIPIIKPDFPTVEQLASTLCTIRESGQITNFGPLSKRLEVAILARRNEDYDGMYAQTVNSCTAGLELAIEEQQLGWPPRDYVLVPSFTFIATATAALRSGKKLLVADVDERTGALTPIIAAQHYHRGLAVVVPVCPLGSLQPIAPWEVFRYKYATGVVLDAAAASPLDQEVGSFPVVFSLHATKLIAAGEGGLVLSANEETIQMIRDLSNFGILRNKLLFSATNAKMSEIHAAVALASLATFHERCFNLAAIAECYRMLLVSFGEAIQLTFNNTGPHNTFCVLLPKTVDLPAVQRFMAERGIDTRRWYSQPIHRLINLPDKDFPVTSMLCDRLLGLPFYPSLSFDDVRKVMLELSNALVDKGSWL